MWTNLNARKKNEHKKLFTCLSILAEEQTDTLDLPVRLHTGVPFLQSSLAEQS